MSAGNFDFCSAMQRLCEDICCRHTAFQHISMDRVAITFAQTRSPVEWGIQAKLTPLRFAGGCRHERRDEKLWTVQRVYRDGREMLYVLTFYLPRFLNLSFEEKLVTVFHELFHIGPAFDGDIRRFGGSCYIHSSSQKAYDQQMAVFVQDYMRMRPDQDLFSFLRYNFQQLQRNHGPVVGLRIAVPKLIPLDEAA